jgi:uncharacterized damage-inducible protein DinB
MQTQQETINATAGKELFIKMAVSAWETQNTRVNNLLNKISDEQLSGETAPGRNSGLYLLGHLTAVNDALFPIFGWGEKLYPELEAIFLSSPDKSGLDTPSIADVKKYWNDVNAKLTQHIEAMQPDEWFTRHNNVSAEDFEKEPFRNKLNILINRTNHQSYHLGQMTYLVKKQG